LKGRVSFLIISLGDKLQSIFREVSEKDFLQSYWQKKPILLRKAFSNFDNPLSSEKLFELAQRPEVHSRLVLEREEGLDLNFGPFGEEDFEALEKVSWTLLLNEMNTHDQALETLLKKFFFLPSWRIDDIMVSHSSKGGSVGAHVDSYDVFLIQAQGRKRWKIGTSPYEGETLENESGLKLIPPLSSYDEYILEPGDILYLPPNIAHHGESLDDGGMTFSVGMIAPALEDLNIVYLADLGLNERSKKNYLKDPDFSGRSSSSEITDSDIKNAIFQMEELLLDNSIFIKSFGKVITENRRERLEEEEDLCDGLSEEEFEEKLNQGPRFKAHPSLRMAYWKNPNHLHFFANGEEYELALEDESFIKNLEGRDFISLSGQRNDNLECVLFDLHERGLLQFE
jgi:50S ribosomal protein L16 3-hydroxylase